MLNFRKKIFLFLTILTTVLCLASCNDTSNTVRVYFSEDAYEVRMEEYLDVKPIIEAAASMSISDIEVVYESSDESVVRYQHGVLYPQSEGEATIKVYWKDKEVVFDKATVKVIKAALPTLHYETVTVIKGDKVQLPYTLYKNYTDAVANFTALTPEIAEIDENGMVTAHQVGEATFSVVISDYAETSEPTEIKVDVIEADYAISYVLNGGTNAETNPSGYNALELPLELTAPTKPGYVFEGWIMNGEDLVQAVPAGTLGDVTLEAVWSVEDYAVNYELGETGVNAETNPETYNVESLPITLADATRPGFVFKGWTLNGETVTEIPTGTLGEITLVAVWEKEAFKLELNLDGGEFVVTADTTNATVMQQFNITNYLKYSVDGSKACINNYTSFGVWWYFIALKETSVSGIYEIVQIVSTSKKVTEEYDLVISWHDSIADATVKAALKAMYNNASSYVGQYVVLSNVPAEASNDCNVNVTVYDASTVTMEGAPVETFSSIEEVVLPTPTKAGYEFTGWYDGEKTVEKVEVGTDHDVKFVATWKVVNYNMTYDFDGGKFVQTADMTNAEVVKTFTISDYLTNTVDGTKACVNNYTSFGSWWYFVALKETAVPGMYEITQIVSRSKNVEAGYDLVISWHDSIADATAKAALTAMYNNASSYVGQYVTLENVPTEATHSASVSVKVIKANSVQLSTGLTSSYNVETEVELPTPVKEGFNFLGWYIGETKVEKVAMGTTGDLVLVAKWAPIVVKHTVTFELNGGTCDELPTEYEEGKTVTLPTPVKEGFKFLGWYDNAEFTGEAVTEISADATSDVTFYANWEKEVVAEEFTIEYDLNGGQWADTTIKSHEEMAKAFMAVWSAYYGLEETVAPADFMKESYGKDLDAFFEDTANAEWTWIKDFVVKWCKDASDQYASNIADKDAQYHGTILRGNVHGFLNKSLWDTWPKSADYSTVTFESYSDKLPAGKVLEGPTTYKTVEGAELVTPVKENYVFVGWILDGQVVETIAAGTTGNLTLTAKWRKANVTVLEVGAEKAYKTLGEALAVAEAGDIVKVDAGTYEGATVTVEGVTIQGANAGINPVNDVRVAETVFTTDIIIAANGVTVDGIQLTGDARIAGSANGTSNTTLVNVLVNVSTLNKGSSDSKNAPFCFFTETAGVKHENIVIANCANINTNEGRPMIFFGSHIENLTIKDCKFVGKRSNYNDGIKINKDANDFTIKGEINIIGNYFENYAQYVIWFNGYSEGTYTLENNTFVNCGQTASSHAAVTFNAYQGANAGLTTINFNYNKVDNSYSLVRIDANTSRTADTQSVHVNYNKLYNCKATYFVNHKNAHEIDATNNYYDKAPTAELFLNAAWEPYYSDENKVPVYGQPLSFYAIEYTLNGGKFEGVAPESFDSTTGLETLPTPTKENNVFVGWMMDGAFVTSIPVGTTSTVKLTAVWRENAIYVSKNGEDYAVATLAEALAKAQAGDKIIVLAGEYEENITISVANLTLAGVNQGVNPNTDTRSAEAVIKGVITVSATATGLVIDGLAFTGNAKVVNEKAGDNHNGFTFMNNVVYDTVKTSDYVLNRYVTNAFIQFRNNSGSTKNFEIFNNKFTNVPDVNVLINRTENVTIDGNTFVDFGLDAVRLEGGYNYGILSFTNNHFEQTVAGKGNSAIFTYAISGSAGTTTKAIVKGNTFKQVGSNDSSRAPYNGAISSHFFQENTTSWEITDNVFDHCENGMWIRNNGANIAPWSCKVENNKFLGVPKSFYFGTYQGSDTITTNPHVTVFGENYYEDNEGNVITDLSQYAEMFKHLSTYGTAAATEPTLNQGEKYEFWSITYVLNGGTAKGLLLSYNKDTGTITLPTPTWNMYHEFKHWTLNGEVVTEIPAGTKGDLVIVAEWTEIEGNPVTLEFELNGGNWNYGSVNDIALDLLKDYNAYKGTSYTQANLPLAAWDGIDVANFFYSDGMKEKWSWLATWLGQVGGTANKKACSILPNYDTVDAFNAVNSNYKYAVTYEFRGFMVLNKDYSNGNYKSSDYTDTDITDTIWAAFTPTIVSTIETTEGKVLTLPTPKKLYLEFDGWYDNAELTGTPVTQITVGATNAKLYAKWIDKNPVTTVNVKNPITETKRFTSLQLEWEVLPAEAANKEVKFISSDSKLATVTSAGYVEFLVPGQVTIKVVSSSNEKVYAEMTVNVFVPEHIEGSFATNSHVVVGQAIQLNAELKQGTGTIVWSSKNPEIATVANGVVTGVKAGTATIVASKEGNAEVSLEFEVVVVDSVEEGVVEYLMTQNNANIFLRSQLGIGAGNYVYYADVLSSTSKLLFEKYEVDKKYYTDSPKLKNHSGERTGALEFITVHYTGNMAGGSTAGANANYFVNQSTGSSIHYVTGNDGIFACYDEKYVCWHAADGTSVPFEWSATGVMVKEGDPFYPVVTITENSKFAINGTETTITCPSGHPKVWSATLGKMVEDESVTIVPTDSKYLTDFGPAVKVVDGQYYMGTTWWCNIEIAEGRVCSKGGNLNSIGIESACNEGSDLWFTWQRTAKLVADLLIRYDLSIDRVKGHNAFSAKDCPQPLLENDDEIWWQFIELVKAEKTAMTTYKDWTFTCVSNNPEIVNNLGRVINQPEFDTCVTYTVTATNGEQTKTITMSSMVPGIYRNLAQGER